MRWRWRVFAAATHGFVRTISRSLAACELVHVARQPFDLARAAAQHDAYVRELRAAGVDIGVLPEAPDLPDATFDEDPAVVFDECAILGRPGVRSREPEAALIAPVVARIRRVFEIRAPGTLEGGDVLRLERTLFVGRSRRTNDEGIRQLVAIVAPFGYTVQPVAVNGGLHLKTAITAPAAGLLVANPRWIDIAAFHGHEILSVPADEPWAANTLPVNGRVLVAASARRTADSLVARGLDVRRIEIVELQKAEAGLTCLSVLYAQSPAGIGS